MTAADTNGLVRENLQNSQASYMYSSVGYLRPDVQSHSPVSCRVHQPHKDHLFP